MTESVDNFVLFSLNNAGIYMHKKLQKYFKNLHISSKPVNMRGNMLQNTRPTKVSFFINRET